MFQTWITIRNCKPDEILLTLSKSFALTMVKCTSVSKAQKKHSWYWRWYLLVKMFWILKQLITHGPPCRERLLSLAFSRSPWRHTSSKSTGQASSCGQCLLMGLCFYLCESNVFVCGTQARSSRQQPSTPLVLRASCNCFLPRLWFSNFWQYFVFTFW